MKIGPPGGMAADWYWRGMALPLAYALKRTHPSWVSSTAAKPVMIESLADRRCAAIRPRTVTRVSCTVASASARAATPRATGKDSSIRARFSAGNRAGSSVPASACAASASTPGLRLAVANRTRWYSEEPPLTRALSPSSGKPVASWLGSGPAAYVRAAASAGGIMASSALDSGSTGCPGASSPAASPRASSTGSKTSAGVKAVPLVAGRPWMMLSVIVTVWTDPPNRVRTGPRMQ